MTRAAMLALALASPIAAARAASGEPPPARLVPSRLRAKRFFLIGRGPDGAELVFWLDNDGGGFIFADVLARYGLSGSDPGFFARLLPNGDIPPQADRLPVIARDPAEPLFAGIDGQLGASWFSRRVVTLDYRAATVTLGTPDAARPLGSLPQRGQTALLAGLRRRASLDTAASVALEPSAALVTGGEPLQATTFIIRATLRALTALHPDLRIRPGAGSVPGIDLVQIPQLTFGDIVFAGVWCTTRPNDDVFEGDAVDVKLGANAFGDRILILDGVRQTFAFR